MATNFKKLLLLSSAIGVYFILVPESSPPKITQLGANTSKSTDNRSQSTRPVYSGYLPNMAETDDVVVGEVKPETVQKLKNNQCTLAAIKTSNLNRQTKREFRGFAKAFDKKEMKKLVKLQSKVQRILNTDKGRERYFKFYNFIADLYRDERSLFCDDDPITQYLQFIELVIGERNSLTLEDVDLIIFNHFERIKNFSVLEYFIWIISVDIKFGEDITLVLLNKLNFNSKLQHQPLALYSGVYWMLLHSFNTLSGKSKEIVWRQRQIQFVTELFKNINELPENKTARKRLLVFMIVSGHQVNPRQFSVKYFLEKFIDKSLSIDEQAEVLIELTSTWLSAVNSINAYWLTEEQVNELLIQFVDYANRFNFSSGKTALKQVKDTQMQEELLWLVAELGKGSIQSSITLAIELLQKRQLDSERLSRYLLERAELLGQDHLFMQQINRLISLYPEDLELNKRRYLYLKSKDKLSINDINQQLILMQNVEYLDDQILRERVFRHRLLILQDRATYYDKHNQFGLAEFDRFQIFEQSPSLNSLTELGKAYNLNSHSGDFIVLFENQIGLLGIPPDELTDEFFTQEHESQFMLSLIKTYSTYADSLESTGSSDESAFIRKVVKRIGRGFE